ncbi:hypothetical protein [Nostoc sp. LPT]
MSRTRYSPDWKQIATAVKILLIGVALVANALVYAQVKSHQN